MGLHYILHMLARLGFVCQQIPSCVCFSRKAGLNSHGCDWIFVTKLGQNTMCILSAHAYAPLRVTMNLHVNLSRCMENHAEHLASATFGFIYIYAAN